MSQGKLTVPSIDDKEDMQFADEAFDILGFSTQMKYDVFRNTACMMHMGNMTKDFVPVGKEEQAEIKDEVEETQKLSHTNICSPNFHICFARPTASRLLSSWALTASG